MPYANVNNMSIYFEVHGKNGSPLLMIHGLGANKNGWSPNLVQLFATQHRVIIFDNRGVGQSDKPWTPYTMADFADDAVGILNTLQIDQADVFGVSMGGMIAQHVALNHPTRVRSLILGCTSSGWLGNPQFVAPSQEVLAQLAKPSSGDRVQDEREGWTIMHSPAFIEAHRDLLEQGLLASLAQKYPETPDHANQLQMEAIVNTHDVYHRLSSITCPTLIQTGTEDVLVPPENSQLMFKLIPGAQLIEYPGGGHGFFWECEEKVAQDILAFVAGI